MLRPLGSHFAPNNKIYSYTMQNLLPVEEKKKVIMEYRVRLGIAVVFTLAVLITVNLVLLAPSYLLAVSESTFISEELSSLETKGINKTQEKDVYAKIKDVNKKIDMFLKTGNSNKWIPSELFMKIISIKTPAIKINGFSYDTTAGRERIVLTGRADDRENLARFIEELKRDKIFTKVELPISSYVKSKNIEFSIVLERILVTQTQKK